MKSVYKKKIVLLVFGTRPEAIKMAPLVLEFKKQPEKFEVIVCVTGQHREMMDQVLELFEIVPEYDLNIMEPKQDLYDITTKVLLGMRNVLNQCTPDIILVHGDTSTSTAAALSAFYRQVPVGHIEAGLRTRNIYSPWPEEMNRQLTSRIATDHFAPTELSRRNLLDEGVLPARILTTGNTVIDALHLALDKIKKKNELYEMVLNQLEHLQLDEKKIRTWEACTSLGIGRRMILITGHRRENFGQGFLNVCRAIRTLANLFPEVDFVYPMHLNPNVRKAVNEVFEKEREGQYQKSEEKNIYFIEPVNYLPFVYLMSISYLILTDSGGIQEEAPSLGKPVLVMRDTTERPEAVQAGTVKLVGTNEEMIVSQVSRLLNDESYYESMSVVNNPYGTGNACQQIVEYYT